MNWRIKIHCTPEGLLLQASDSSLSHVCPLTTSSDFPEFAYSLQPNMYFTGDLNELLDKISSSL